MKVILHHTAVSRKAQPYQVWAVNRYHQKKWDFRSSLGFYGGYHYFIEPNGYMVQFRNTDEKGAHTIGYNDDIGVCLAGDFNQEMPTTEQVKKLEDLLLNLKEWEGIESEDLFLHKDLQENRNCPGSYITQDWFRNLADPDYGENDSDEDEEKKIQLMLEQRNLLDRIKTLLHQILSTLGRS